MEFAMDFFRCPWQLWKSLVFVWFMHLTSGEPRCAYVEVIISSDLLSPDLIVIGWLMELLYIICLETIWQLKVYSWAQHLGSVNSLQKACWAYWVNFIQWSDTVWLVTATTLTQAITKCFTVGKPVGWDSQRSTWWVLWTKAVCVCIYIYIYICLCCVQHCAAVAGTCISGWQQ